MLTTRPNPITSPPAPKVARRHVGLPADRKRKKELARPADPRDQVIAWLLEGQRDADIVEALREKWPKADAAALLTAAVEHFESAANCQLSVVVGWGLEAYKDLYRRMIAAGDFAGALKAVKEIIALAGKYVCDKDEETTA